MRFFKSLVPCLVLASVVSLSAEPGQATPDPARGTVNSSGKFVPAGDPEQPATPPEDWEKAAAELIENTGPDTFRIGVVTCDRKAGTLTIPVKVNARKGLIEYAVVTTKGKVHEALLATTADPFHVQIAALLLGLSPEPGKIDGRSITIALSWSTNGPAKSVSLEKLVGLTEGTPLDPIRESMAAGPWTYTGSTIDSQGFAAAREGSIISLIEDPAALIVNPRPSRLNDSHHVPNSVELPADGVPINLTIRLQKVETP